MKTWQLEDSTTLKLIDEENVAKPLSEGFARVKVTNVAINRADISVYDGKINVDYPIVPTRVATGLVSEALGAKNYLNKGQRVLISSHVRGNDNQNILGINRDGLLTEYVTIPINSLYELSFQDEANYLDTGGIKDIEALFIDDIALCINVVNKLDIKQTEYIVLYGASYMNLIIAELAMYYQAIPIVIDNDADRIALATDIGCYYTINTQEENAIQKVLEITSGKMADYLAFDTDSFSNAQDIGLFLKVGGKICLYGFNTAIDRLSSDLGPIIKNQLTVFGVTSSNGAIESAINMLMNDVVKVDSFVADITEFDKADEVFKDMSSQSNFLKHIIKV